MIDATSTPPGAGGPAPLHLARPGTFTDLHGQRVEVTADLLTALAASYDPARFRAPLVVGHPQTNSPAFGWLDQVRATPAGLFGTPVQVDPAFAAAVNAGRYPHRSLSFWPADHPGSPVPGQPYIRHLGVLGAHPPAIPGLQGADLAGSVPDGLHTIDFSLPTELAMPDPVPVPVPTPGAAPATIDLAAQTSALAAREAALTQAQAALDARHRALAEQEAAARRAAVIAFAEGLANEARLRPADIPALSEILLRLEETAPAVCFAAAAAPTVPATGADWFKEFLSNLPPLVELGEVATSARAAAAAPTVDFAAPSGYAVETTALALHHRALAYQRHHPQTDYVTAIAAVGG